MSLPPPSPDADSDQLDLADIAAGRTRRSGAAPAWSRLLARYQDRLFGVCLRMLGPSTRARQTAADLTQDAMVKIIQGLGTFDGSAKFSTWAFRVTMNVCLSHLRGEKLRKHASLDGESSDSVSAIRSFGTRPDNPGPDREPDGHSRVSHSEQQARVASALGQIDADQRSILVLRDVRGLDYDQIAQVLGVAVGTVKSRLFRARAALREALEAIDAQSTPPAPSQTPQP